MISERKIEMILMYFMTNFVKKLEKNFMSIRSGRESKMRECVRRALPYINDGAFGRGIS